MNNGSTWFTAFVTAVVTVLIISFIAYGAYHDGQKSWWHDKDAMIVTHEDQLYKLVPVWKSYKEAE